MLKFVIGVLIGAVLALGYVRYNLQLPRVLQLPGELRGGVVSAATEGVLYNLDGDEQERLRALEVFFTNRPGDAAATDAAAGYPFLSALHDARARREAQQLLAQLPAFDKTLAQPALRDTLERQYGTAASGVLKQRMLLEGLDRRPFLKRWLEKSGGPVTADDVRQPIASAASRAH
jgi:hypothetical protein